MKFKTRHTKTPSQRPPGWRRALGGLAVVLAAPWPMHALAQDLAPATELADLELGPGLTAGISQVGVNNRAGIVQAGASTLGTIKQYGANNEANLLQAGAGNVGAILQIGSGNEASLKQYLNGGRADLTQIGTNNQLSVIQRYTPYVPVTQIGRNLQLTLYR